VVGSLAMKDGADPFVFVLYREVIASVLMIAYAKYCGLNISMVAVPDRGRFLVLGFFSFGNVVGAMLALKYISATRFSIFQPIIPVVATTISIAIGLEKFTVMKACGIGLAVGGAIITETWKTSGSGEDEESNVILGTIIVSFQVCAMGALIVFAKPMLSKYPPSIVTVVYYGCGSIYTLLLCAAWSWSLVPMDFVFDGHLLPWLALAYAATFATFYPYNAFSWSGKQLTSGVTTVYCTFQPVGTILLSLALFGVVLTLPEALGAVLVMGGLVLTVLAQNREPKGHGDEDDEEQNHDHRYGYNGGSSGGGGGDNGKYSDNNDATVRLLRKSNESSEGLNEKLTGYVPVVVDGEA